MSLKDTHYDAFISYRHSELDKFVATNLQKKLETFKLPKSLYQKTGGRTRIERVFRDQDELPLASNLSDPIEEALSNSDYLIVICTPRLPESQWCRKEIETFMRLHGRDHILAVLAEGEPSESFPYLLLHEDIVTVNEQGESITVTRDIEPLAADVRGSSFSHVKKNLNDAVLRIAAPIFGLNYDDLKQRHKERRMKKLLTIGASIGAAILAFAIVCTFLLVEISSQKNTIEDQYEEISQKKDEIEAQNAEIKEQNSAILKQNREIEEQKNTIKKHYDEASLKYAKIMSNVSKDLMNTGRRNDAIYAIRSALPHNSETADIPYSADGHLALNNVLDLYNVSEARIPMATYDCPNPISDFKVNASGTIIAIYDSEYNLYVMDAVSSELLYSFDNTEFNHINYIKFKDDNTLFFTSDQGWISLNVTDGTYRVLNPDVSELYYLDNAGLIGAKTLSTVFIFRTSDMLQIGSLDLSRFTDSTWMCILSSLQATDDGKYLYGYIQGNFTAYDQLVVFDASLYPIWAKPYDTYYTPLFISDNDSIYEVSNISTNSFDSAYFSIAKYSITDGTEIWSRVYDESFNFITDLFYDSYDDLLVLASSTELYTISAESGQITQTYSYQSPYCDIYPAEKGIYFIFCKDGSLIGLIPSSNIAMDMTGSYYTTPPKMNISNIHIVDGKFFIEPQNNNYISMYDKVNSPAATPIGQHTYNAYKTTLDGLYSINYEKNDETGDYNYSLINNADNTTIYTITDGNYNIALPVKNNDLLISSGMFSIKLYDISTGTLLKETDTEAVTVQGNSEAERKPISTNILNNSLSENGKYIALDRNYLDGDSIIICDLSSGEAVASYDYNTALITINDTTKRVAFISDNQLVLGDLDGNIQNVLSLESTSVRSLLFSEDGRYLLTLQETGDLVFYDASTLEQVNICTDIPTELDLTAFIYSEAYDTYMVLSSLSNCHVFEPKTLSLVAEIAHCKGYNHENDTLTLYNSDTIYSIPYFGYDEVLQEADEVLNEYVCSEYIKKKYGIN